MTAAPDRLLDGLNEAQRDAVQATDGPVAIIAGAGTGKTRVISRRAAFAIANGVVPADQVLIVTFTDKAAGEMSERLRGLGLHGVIARTFHAHALSQIRHFWPLHHGGDPLPRVLESKTPILSRIARGLPGHYRFTAAKDLADEIEWAKSRRLVPGTYAAAVETADREPPLPLDLFVRVFADYERAKSRSGQLDFDDMLLGTVELLEGDDEAAEIIRSRKRWFSVDEYQDTNLLQQTLLELWLGDRRDVCVVGDEDQTIYSFSGATSTYLTTFADRHADARVIALTENYRSSPEILEVANQLIAATGRQKRLTATRPSGPRPQIARHPSADAETEAICDRIRALVAAGTPAAEIAILVRTNAQLAPIESALTRASIAYRVRGLGFYARPDVRQALDVVRRVADADEDQRPSEGRAVGDDLRQLWAKHLAYDDAAVPVGGEARERAAALETLLAIADTLAAAEPSAGRAAYLAEVARRAEDERSGSTTGVELATYHRAKGLEWDAVFLPMLEEGSLPIRQAFDDDAALEEERRLLYVGITRARTHLVLSWAAHRDARGRDSRRRPSRFLESVIRRTAAGRANVAGDAVRAGGAMRTADAGRSRARRVVELADAFSTPSADPSGTAALFEALRAWRQMRAREDDVPAYVVAHDSTLTAIADARPGSLAALRRVHGMGPTKLERYGAQILAVVQTAR